MELSTRIGGLHCVYVRVCVYRQPREQCEWTDFWFSNISVKYVVIGKTNEFQFDAVSVDCEAVECPKNAYRQNDREQETFIAFWRANENRIGHEI